MCTPSFPLWWEEPQGSWVTAAAWRLASLAMVYNTDGGAPRKRGNSPVWKAWEANEVEPGEEGGGPPSTNSTYEAPSQS